MSANDLLFEIGCEELPASYVDGALKALVPMVQKRFAELRLSHGEVRAVGTPRRLALLIDGVATTQTDLEEEVMGPPAKIAFKDGVPTRAAEAFAKKLGVAVDALEQVETPKGAYLKGTLRETGRPAAELLPAVLSALVTDIPFRKSMRWGDGALSFGRPLRWLFARFGSDALKVSLPGIPSTEHSYGHRFLHPDEVAVAAPSQYIDALRRARVVVDPVERAATMSKRLHEAAKAAGGDLIEDAFLIGENLSLVEEPQVIVGGFEDEFLELPEGVILEVARGHQRYFGMRAADGKLLPKYLAVVNTAENPDTIRVGNDRVMRARLADAQFFHREDLKRPLAERSAELEGIVFQNKLGSVKKKVERIGQLVTALGAALSQSEEVVNTAVSGAALCKCDLVTLMVGEFPSLQGDVGRSYALVQGVAAAVADTISEHYLPKGAKGAMPASAAGTLVALADRLDTLVGCFGVGLSPTGAADPFGLRRACIGSLRLLLNAGFDLSLVHVFRAAYATFDDGVLTVSEDDLVKALGSFFRDRLRGLLGDSAPNDAVNAALGVAADRPIDAKARAVALATLDEDVRQRLGEVFKRATNIAKNAPTGDPEKGSEPAEVALHDAFFGLQDALSAQTAAGDYPAAFASLASLASPLATYFDDVMVMAEDEAVRANRLRLMRTISDSCVDLARLELLGGQAR